jgi:hypothetical protein
MSIRLGLSLAELAVIVQVSRSTFLSDHPFVAAHRELIHKIEVTGSEVEPRIANASLDTTYLPRWVCRLREVSST